MKAIVDTGFIVAFANRNDRYHAWAVDLIKRLTIPLLTCEPVLAEASFHLASAEYVLGLATNGMLKMDFGVAENLSQLAWLAARYRDRQPDLADLCLIRMSELHPNHSVVTVDESDFRVYRRNKRDIIPLLCPPQQR
jgi:uncharacterized protein